MCFHRSHGGFFGNFNLVFFRYRTSNIFTLLLWKPPLLLSLSFSKIIEINIIDDEEYEKNKNFFLEIGEPQLLEMSERKGGGVAFLCCNPAHITNDL